MEIITIQTMGKHSLRFRGELLAKQESQRIETGSGAVWFELSAFRRDDDKVIVVIRSQRRDWDSKQTVDHYEVDSKEEVIQVVRSFDFKSMVPPRAIAAPNEPKHRQIIDETNDAFFAASRRFFKKLDAPMSEFGQGLAAAERQNALRREAEDARPGALNRLRAWLAN